MQKGQGAIEYLMTYGWALLVIVVVGAALYAAGVLNPASYVANKCTGFQYFVWQNQKMATNDYVLEVLNGREDVTITNLLVDGNPRGVSGFTNPVSSGRRITIGDNSTTNPTGKVEGDTFSVTVTVIYNTTTIAGIRDSASCTGRVQ